MTIPLLTLTGVDERTPIDWMLEAVKSVPLMNHKPVLEFGILRSPKAGTAPRFPSVQVIDRIVESVPPSALAFHLCGRYARMVHEGHWWDLVREIDFKRVSRVQVNSIEYNERAMLNLQRFSIFINLPVIMQWRGGSFPLVPGLHLLQDRSGGKGIVETAWIAPEVHCRAPHTEIGYAGGLNPANINGAISVIAKAAERPWFWIDCESGIRTDDWFDVIKAQAMIDAVCLFHRFSARDLGAVG
jgi:hypothetical protein